MNTPHAPRGGNADQSTSWRLARAERLPPIQGPQTGAGRVGGPRAAGGPPAGAAAVANGLTAPRGIKTRAALRSSNPGSGRTPKGNELRALKRSVHPVFRAELFTVAQARKQPASTDNGVNKETVSCGHFRLTKGGDLPLAAAWTTLEDPEISLARNSTTAPSHPPVTSRSRVRGLGGGPGRGRRGGAGEGHGAAVTQGE